LLNCPYLCIGIVSATPHQLHHTTDAIYYIQTSSPNHATEADYST
jgi:hypothetical protein